MEYRKLPHGNDNETFSVLGLGFGGIGTTPPEEIEAIVCKAIDNGINFFDMCTAGATYAPFGCAIKGRREKVFIQVHFGAVYDENGEYGWCRDFETIKKTFRWELETLGIGSSKERFALFRRCLLRFRGYRRWNIWINCSDF